MLKEQSFHVGCFKQGSVADFTGVIQCVRQRVPKFSSEFINSFDFILVLPVYNSISCDMVVFKYYTVTKILDVSIITY